jgi:hypothetical protein
MSHSWPRDPVVLPLRLLARLTPDAVVGSVGPGLLGQVMAACQANPTYLDRFYTLQPGRVNGAKRLLVLLPLSVREKLPPGWIEAVGEYATLVWRAGPEVPADDEMEPHEYIWEGDDAAPAPGQQGSRMISRGGMAATLPIGAGGRE